jgi:hypothetical protein
VIFTVELPEGIKVGGRVVYSTGFDVLGIEALAINVRKAEPIKPAAPVAVIKDAKIAKR